MTCCELIAALSALSEDGHQDLQVVFDDSQTEFTGIYGAKVVLGEWSGHVIELIPAAPSTDTDSLATPLAVC